MRSTNNLFRFGDFTNRAGHETHFLINCAALTDAELASLAAFIAPTLAPFGSVYGIPSAGTRFAKGFEPFITRGPRLVVDDVAYTDQRFHDIAEPGDICVVIFNRAGKAIPGIMSVFTMDPALR